MKTNVTSKYKYNKWKAIGRYGSVRIEGITMEMALKAAFSLRDEDSYGYSIAERFLLGKTGYYIPENDNFFQEYEIEEDERPELAKLGYSPLVVILKAPNYPSFELWNYSK